MLLIILLSSVLTIVLMLLVQAIGIEFLLNSFEYILIFMVSLLAVVIGTVIFHEKIWNKLTSLVQPKVDQVSIYLSQQIRILRDALLTANHDQIQIVTKNVTSEFSKWYQKYLFRRFLLRSIIGLIVASAGIATLVLWDQQNAILQGQLSAVSEQVSLQRQQWFLSQRTELMSLLFDRQSCDAEKCPHLANLRTRTQAAIALVQMGKNELHSIAGEKVETARSRVIQPESLINLSYVDLSDADIRRQKTPGHGAYLANLDWNSVVLMYANMDHSNLASSDFSNAKIQYASLSNSNINHSVFINVFAMGANFAKAHGEKVNFSNADLLNSNFSGARITQANFQGAQLSGAMFYNAILTGANFRQAKGLSCSQLRSAKNTVGILLPKGMRCELNK